jgi:hypothetical protein
VYVDPIAALAPADRVSYLVPGRVQIDLGGTAIEGPGGTRPIQVSLIAQQGNQVRAAVRLEHARFSLWTIAIGCSRCSRATSIQTITNRTTKRACCRVGAVVKRLARKDKRSQVRYNGALEIEAGFRRLLADEGPPRPDRAARATLGCDRSTCFRRRFAASRGGRRNNSPPGDRVLLDTIKEVDRAWAIVAYDDTDLSVRLRLARSTGPRTSRRIGIAPARSRRTARSRAERVSTRQGNRRLRRRPRRCSRTPVAAGGR